MSMKIIQTENKQICEIHGEYTAYEIRMMTRSIWSRCPKCSEEIREREQQKKRKIEQISMEKQKQDFYRKSGIMRRYQGIKLANIQPYKSQVLPIRFARKFIDRFKEMSKEGKTLIFCGTLGTGKTMIVSAMIQTLGHGRYCRAIDIGREIRSSYTNINRNISEKEVINSFVSPEFLVIDEVGVNQGTENEQMLITDVIDRRYCEMKPTVICSNLNRSGLAIFLGASAWDRLMQNCMIIPMTGNSLRSII